MFERWIARSEMAPVASTQFVPALNYLLEVVNTRILFELNIDRQGNILSAIILWMSDNQKCATTCATEISSCLSENILDYSY